MLCSTKMAECMLLVTTYMYLYNIMNITKTNRKLSCSKCNGLLIMIGVKTEITKHCYKCGCSLVAVFCAIVVFILCRAATNRTVWHMFINTVVK